MAKVYFVRHQAHGVAHEFPFAQPPSDAQVALVAKYCNQLHGFTHPKTPDVPYWTKVVEREILGAADLPKVPDRALGEAGVPGAAKTATSGMTATGTGVITEGKR